MDKELIKEKISWYKLLFTILVTVTAGSIGWYVSNHSTASPFFLIIDSIAYTGFSIGLIFCFAKIRFYFKKLEEVKNV